MFDRERKNQLANVELMMAKVTQLTGEARTSFEADLQRHSEAQDLLKKSQAEYAKKLETLSKKDPFPQEKIDQLKEEIRTEMNECFSPKRGSRNSFGKVAGMLGSEQSKTEEEEADLDDLGDKTSLKDLINQINQMNDKIPKRFEKFQQAMDEKQKVSDAKMKQMLKAATDKLGKGA